MSDSPQPTLPENFSERCRMLGSSRSTRPLGYLVLSIR